MRQRRSISRKRVCNKCALSEREGEKVEEKGKKNEVRTSEVTSVLPSPCDAN